MLNINVVEHHKKRIVNPYEMKQGQVGKIIKWGCSNHYIGEIVAKSDHENYLTSLDKASYWNDCDKLANNDYQIELFDVGTQLIITVEK